MSGTSLDGIDLAHVTFELDSINGLLKSINAETISYTYEDWNGLILSNHLSNC